MTDINVTITDPDPIHIDVIVADLFNGDSISDMISAAINAHINDTTPHPQYDDHRSYTLLFENRLV